jgi:glycosyltransferase involved in cell wall biosynthesis
MAASDVVVNASQPEPFGLVVVEAMAAGCAVAAVAAGGPRDIIEDGRNGLLCASREPSDLAQAIGRLCDHPELRDELGLAARSRVESQFSREAMAERFATIVMNAADGR